MSPENKETWKVRGIVLASLLVIFCLFAGAEFLMTHSHKDDNVGKPPTKWVTMFNNNYCDVARITDPETNSTIYLSARCNISVVSPGLDAGFTQ